MLVALAGTRVKLLSLGIAAMATLIVLSGCGPSVGRLSGKVLFQGKPVPSTEIQLSLKDNPDKTYRGLSLADGTYQLDYGHEKGLPAGVYHATVTYFQTAEGQPLPAGEAGAVLKQTGKAVEQKYVLEISVAPGSQTLDLNLDRGTLETPVAAP